MDRGVLCAVNDNRTIRVSVGTAAALGLVNVRCDILPSTAYLMTCGGCVSRCAFCAQARSSNSSEADVYKRQDVLHYNVHKKMKTDTVNSLTNLKAVLAILEKTDAWKNDVLYGLSLIHI